jgi:hypothetical protein
MILSSIFLFQFPLQTSCHVFPVALKWWAREAAIPGDPTSAVRDTACQEQTGRLTHGVLLNVEGSKFIFIITTSNLAEAPYFLPQSDFTEEN